MGAARQVVLAERGERRDRVRQVSREIVRDGHHAGNELLADGAHVVAGSGAA